MEKDAGFKLEKLAVDGGACQNNYLMQFQADILNSEVIRPKNIESTALGAALLAGMKVNFYKSGLVLKIWVGAILILSNTITHDFVHATDFAQLRDRQ